jgi:hypothetical protein
MRGVVQVYGYREVGKKGNKNEYNRNAKDRLYRDVNVSQRNECSEEKRTGDTTCNDNGEGGSPGTRSHLSAVLF